MKNASVHVHALNRYYLIPRNVNRSLNKPRALSTESSGEPESSGKQHLRIKFIRL